MTKISENLLSDFSQFRAENKFGQVLKGEN